MCQHKCLLVGYCCISYIGYANFSDAVLIESVTPNFSNAVVIESVTPNFTDSRCFFALYGVL